MSILSSLVTLVIAEDLNQTNRRNIMCEKHLLYVGGTGQDDPPPDPPPTEDPK